MKTAKFFNLKEAVPRALGDFAVIHLAAIASLLLSVYLRLGDRPEADIRPLLHYCRSFYFTRFLPLSGVFPAILALNGLYSTSRGYAIRYKYWVVLRSAGLAMLVYLFTSFMLTRQDLMPRSSVLAFSVLACAGLVCTRWLKGMVWREEQARLAPDRSAGSVSEKPVLVVGGAGYIGSMVCHLLIERGRKVRVLDSLVYGDSAIRDLLPHPNFELQQGDCRNIRDVVKACSGVKSVVHLAAIVGDPACELDHVTALEVNYSSTRMLIEIAKGQKTERFVFASSCSVYGAADVLMDENSAVGPVSLYGRTKVDSEHALLESVTVDFHPVILRLATVFGNSYRPRFDLVVNLLTAQAAEDGLITVYNGGQWRPFIHVRDAACGLIAALDSPLSAVSGDVFNLGDNRLNATLADVAEQIRGVFPATRINRVDNADLRNYRVSFDKIRSRIGFQCGMSLADGIQELKAALETGAIPDYRDILYHNQRYLARAGAPESRGSLQTEVMAAFSAAAGR